MTLRDEILEQPEAARRQLASSSGALEELAGRLRADPVASVVIAARGTSDHAAIYAQYVLGVRNRLSVGLATPSVVSLYDAEPNVRDSLVIGISQSGACRRSRAGRRRYEDVHDVAPCHRAAFAGPR